MRRVSSRHHPLVTACRTIARGGRDDGRVLLDGLHLVSEARAAGLRILTAAFTPRLLATPAGAALEAALEASGAELIEATDPVMRAMSPVSTPSGVVAVAERPDPSLQDALRTGPQLVVMAADMQDPGNVGAIVRAAEAGGATAAVFCGASADPFGWKALRGSMGSALRLPVVSVADMREAVERVRAAGVRAIATLPRGGRRPDEVDLRGPVGFLLGGEGPGLSEEIVESADERVSIPMRPPVESLNVAVAAALLVYEAARQRRTNP